MIEAVAYGTFVGSIINLPDSVVRAWLKELGLEGERLKEREYVSIEQTAMIDGEFHDLIIYRSSISHYLSINPEE